MKKREIISLSGDPSSGKGTVSNILIKELGYGIYRNGEYFRNLAKKMNMNLKEFGDYVKDHPHIDEQIEESAKEYAKDHDKFIIDARLGWYAVPESFKVYLKVDIDEAARRSFYDKNRKDLENYKSIDEYKKSLLERYNLENERYFNIYGIHKDDMNNYDLVIDTSNKTPEEVAKIIIDKYIRWLKN